MSAHPKLIHQVDISLIKKPVLIKEPGGVVLACNRPYLELRRIDAFDLIGHGAYEFLSTIQRDFYNLTEKYLLLSCIDSFEYEGYREEFRLKVLLQRIEFTNKKIDAIQLTITYQAALPTIVDSPFHLTVREISVLQLLMEGNSQKKIALLLCLSHHTIAGYLKAIYIKMGVKSCSQALLIATTILHMRAKVPLKTPLGASPVIVC